MNEIIVFWHKNPDTDCTCASIIFTDYLNKKWLNAKTIKLWKLNNETSYLLNLVGIQEPETVTTLPAGTKVALVDHNEKTQTIDGITDLEIEYLVDHHKFEFSTQAPLNIRAEKLCSTSSILYKMYKEAGFVPDQKIAKLMISAILSDSLLFKSPTTTPEDKVLVEELKSLSWIDDIETHALAMFAAKSDLWDISIDDLIRYDYKVFEVNGKRIGWWTLETTAPNYAMWRKAEILEWLKIVKANDKLDYLFLSIVDIIGEKNLTILLDWEDSQITKDIFNCEIVDNVADLGNRLSRKKQIVPDVTKYFENK